MTRNVQPVLPPKTVPKGGISVPLDEKLLKDFFRSQDTNHDGRLDKHELTRAFKKLGSRLPPWRVMRGLHHADTNGDGCISGDELDDLVNYASKLGYSINK